MYVDLVWAAIRVECVNSVSSIPMATVYTPMKFSILERLMFSLSILINLMKIHYLLLSAIFIEDLAIMPVAESKVRRR